MIDLQLYATMPVPSPGCVLGVVKIHRRESIVPGIPRHDGSIELLDPTAGQAYARIRPCRPFSGKALALGQKVRRQRCTS